jgi:hypothetical protein
MNKIFKYILIVVIIAAFCLIIGDVLFSIGHGRVRRVDIKTFPKELIILNEYAKKEFNLSKDDVIYDLRERNCSEMQNKDNYKYDYQIYIGKITASRYLKDTIALDKKIDSIGGVIKNYLPHKECHEFICINYHLYDSINQTYFHDKEKKYKIN